MPELNEVGGNFLELTMKRDGKVIFSRTAWINQILGNGNVKRYATDDGDLFNVNDNQADPKQIGNRLFLDKGNR